MALVRGEKRHLKGKVHFLQNEKGAYDIYQMGKGAFIRNEKGTITEGKKAFITK